MPDHSGESDALERADSDRCDDSCSEGSSDVLVDTGAHESEQPGLYLAPGDELSCGTHLTLPSASSAGPLSKRLCTQLQEAFSDICCFKLFAGYQELYEPQNPCQQPNGSVMSSHEYYYPQVIFHVAASWHSKGLVCKPELDKSIAGFWLRGILCCQHDVWSTNGNLYFWLVLLLGVAFPCC